MASLIDVERVKFLCSCQRLKPLSSLYYCKYCKPFALKCKECVLHEIDQKYFCSNCFDNKTHNEASATKFKCLNCFACPLCRNSLMMRASSGTAAQKAALKAQALAEQAKTGVETPPPVTKVYYLMCSFCRWTTRDVRIPDVTSIPGNWQQPENINTIRVKALLEAYKIVASREKLEKDRKKYTVPKRRAFHLSAGTDKYGILSPASRRLKSLAGASSDQGPQSIEQQLATLLEPAKTVDNFEPIDPEEFFANSDVSRITTLSQRLSSPEWQPSRGSKLHPLNKCYVNKESKRCNGCEHNVLKPESNITSIRFKLHQMALFLIPDVRIVAVPAWKTNQSCEAILSITNKTEIDMEITLLPLTESLTNLSGFSPTAAISFSSSQPIILDRQDSAKNAAPALRPADVASKGFICFRRDNKVCVRVTVTPSEPIENETPSVRVIFGIKHDLDAKAVTDSSKATSTARPNVVQQVCVDFGPLRPEDGANIVKVPRYVEDLVGAVSVQ